MNLFMGNDNEIHDLRQLDAKMSEFGFYCETRMRCRQNYEEMTG